MHAVHPHKDADAQGHTNLHVINKAGSVVRLAPSRTLPIQYVSVVAVTADEMPHRIVVGCLSPGAAKYLTTGGWPALA